ncbi:MAG TPA: hypothetical protein VGX92_17950 [Pyrinomonadaceae bacterium]|jgi:hypothetical protein|nr:hypothetical protein [Pyrinomonadaceae bacterium]
MPYAQITNYIDNTLSGDVAAYLDAKRNNFANVQNYWGLNNYFTESTVRDVMFACIYNWLIANENPAHVLVVSEVRYPGFNNRCDLAVIYDAGAGGGASRAYIEVKADFNANSVDLDINLLDAVASVYNSPLTNGYAFYVAKNNNLGWVNAINAPIQPNVSSVPIIVVP